MRRREFIAGLGGAAAGVAARGAGYSILSSLAFSVFYRRPPDIQKQLDEGHARFTEFQKKLDEGRRQSDPNAN
jgi:hypothetical protein